MIGTLPSRIRRRFALLPLRSKLGLLVVGSTLLASLLLFVVVTVMEYQTSRQRVEERGQALAQVLAQNTRAALAFADAAAAQRVLEALGQVAEVRWAVLGGGAHHIPCQIARIRPIDVDALRAEQRELRQQERAQPSGT